MNSVNVVRHYLGYLVAILVGLKNFRRLLRAEMGFWSSNIIGLYQGYSLHLLGIMKWFGISGGLEGTILKFHANTIVLGAGLVKVLFKLELLFGIFSNPNSLHIGRS